MHCFSKSHIVIRRYHHFTHRAANHCCQSLRKERLATKVISFLVKLTWRGESSWYVGVAYASGLCE